MTIKIILTEPNKLLRQVSKTVEKVGKDEKQLMDDMLDTMYDAPGIGLAAVQIGVPLRVIVMDISWRNEDGNPAVLSSSVICLMTQVTNRLLMMSTM